MTEYPKSILIALHAVMSDVGYVQKASRNKFHQYNYAGEADLLEKLRPSMLKHGLLLIPSATSATSVDQFGNTTVTMEYTLAHKDGDVWPDKIGAIGTGNDKNKNGVGDKGTYKAITGANKYLLFKLFQIETGDDPETNGTNDTQPAAEPAAQKQLDPDREPVEHELIIARMLKFAAGQATSMEDLQTWWKSDDRKKMFRELPTKLRTEVEQAAAAQRHKLEASEPTDPKTEDLLLAG